MRQEMRMKMNVPPRCEFKEGVDPECGNLAPWVVIDKTEGTIRYICHVHLNLELKMGNTYSIFPAKNYSRPRSFDREYQGEFPKPDGSRCLRCDGKMVPAQTVDKIPDIHLGGKRDKDRRLKPRDTMVCRECGREEGS